MPLYEYRCTKCGHQFEKIQSYSAEDVKDCPVCGSPVERLISAPAVHFSGSGFYDTDYNKSRHSPPPSSSDGPSGSSDSSSSSDKGDSAKVVPTPAPSTATNNSSSTSSSSESKS